MPSIPSGSIDAIITDLPYGVTANKKDIVIPFAPMWKEVERVLKPNGVFISTAIQPFSSLLVCSNLDWFKYDWDWVKNRVTNYLNSKKQPLRAHENIFIFYAKQCTFNAIPFSDIPYKHRSNNKTEGTKNYRSHQVKTSIVYKPVTSAKDVLYFDCVHPDSAEYTGHINQKPVALYEYLIKTYTNEGETVLDIAMGSGTTIEAAERTGRNSIGIEKDEGIFQSAVLRLKSSTPSNNRLHWTGGDSPALPSQSTLEGFTAPEADTTPPASQ
jgi:site-specific DNA-methyltransferase (adenine-specific)